MANPGIANLRVPTSAQAREYGRLGGLASAEAKRRRKAVREDLFELLEIPLSDTPLEEVASFKEFGKKNVTLQQAMIMKQIYKALVDGDTTAFRELMRMAGASEESVNLNVNGAVAVENPYAGLTEEQLLKLIAADE